MKMKLKIVLRYYPDPILEKVCQPVSKEHWEKYFKTSLPTMRKILLEHKGLGLSAPQAGLPLRFFIMKTCVDPDTEQWGSIITIINPEVIDMYEDTTFTEGCLSLPGVKVKMDRKAYVELKYRDEDWNERHGVFCYPESIVVQHEIDHLDGKSIISHLSKGAKKMHIKKVNKFKRLAGL